MRKQKCSLDVLQVNIRSQLPVLLTVGKIADPFPLVTSFQLQNERKTKHFTQFHSTLTQVPVPFGKFQHFVQIHSNLGESTALKNKNSKSCMRKISWKKGNKVRITNMAER
ncbi:hypothetical protein GOODEAATRI_014215 [Goodea atripinnis]|uniref:Uncharacterized protein n=1 Tax=Goodea atripinnis TaxID=208336 RepID=A0ABV0NK61_9TELE